MAKPRVFISSTYYDLKSLRTDLDHFVREQGYDPVLFERGQIAYGKDAPPEEYCHKRSKTATFSFLSSADLLGANLSVGLTQFLK